jgi:NAD(P)-dependent dehydrogenase (short-subunit alcohol dehydrogenase family)
MKERSLLDAKVALISGGASGIGLATAQALITNGWRVGLNDIDADACRAQAENLGKSVVPVPGDVSCDEVSIVRRTLEQFGRLDGLVNSAALLQSGKLVDLTNESMERAWNVNVRSIVNMSNQCLPALARARGAIVNIASVAAFAPVPGSGMYSSTKAAVLALTRQAAAEWGGDGVRVNAVAPGYVRTPMSEASWATPEIAARRFQRIPLGRAGQSHEVADVIVFLLSPRASFVNGTVLTVDGGLSTSLFSEDGTGHDATVGDATAVSDGDSKGGIDGPAKSNHREI